RGPEIVQSDELIRDTSGDGVPCVETVIQGFSADRPVAVERVFDASTPYPGEIIEVGLAAHTSSRAERVAIGHTNAAGGVYENAIKRQAEPPAYRCQHVGTYGCRCASCRKLGAADVGFPSINDSAGLPIRAGLDAPQ